MGITKMNKATYLTKLEQDNVFPASKIVTMQSLTGMPSRRGLEKAVISNGKIVNVVSDGYAHLPNEKFLNEAERQLIDADVNYKTRSINRDDRSFAVDYILDDERYIVKVKNGKDELKPMLRFINSYDGTNKTSGHFGFFRKICSNGLHVAETKIGFGVKHRGDMAEVVMPKIEELVQHFMSNEYYELSKKFEVLAERPIGNLEDFVRFTAKDTKLFKFESSEKNPDPSLNARTIIETIQRETAILGEPANMWIGYNAFNELLHSKLKKTFTQQADIDSRLFESVLAQG